MFVLVLTEQPAWFVITIDTIYRLCYTKARHDDGARHVGEPVGQHAAMSKTEHRRKFTKAFTTTMRICGIFNAG